MTLQAKNSGTLKAKSEIEEIKWLNYNDLDISEVDKKIFSFLNEKES
jgi:hypothetical protein